MERHNPSNKLMTDTINAVAEQQQTVPPEDIRCLASQRWLVMAAVGVGSILGSLDTNVVNIALPTIRHAFATDVASVEWVVTIYLLATCGFLLTFGKIGDLQGQKPVYVCGFVTFVASSALCGLAPSIAVLVLCRAIQGLGASMLHSSAPAILTSTFPANQRGKVLGLQAIMVFLGMLIGPTLGGWLTDHLTWRSVFYINVPIGLIALVLSVKFIPDVKSGNREGSFDFTGAALFLIAFSLMLIGLSQGHAHGWTSRYILTIFAVALALLIGFVVVESHTSFPLLDLSLFRVRSFSMSVASAVCYYMAVFTVGFLMPFLLIQGRGLSPSEAGLLISLQPATMIIVAPVAGAFSDRIGTRGLAVFGTALLGLALFLLSFADTTIPLRYIGIAMVMIGFGSGCFMAPNNSTMLGSAPKHRQGIAAGVLATARYVGMICGVGISGAIFTTFVRAHTDRAFYRGIHISFLVACAISCVGCYTSAARKHQAITV